MYPIKLYKKVRMFRSITTSTEINHGLNVDIHLQDENSQVSHAIYNIFIYICLFKKDINSLSANIYCELKHVLMS